MKTEKYEILEYTFVLTQNEDNEVVLSLEDTDDELEVWNHLSEDAADKTFNVVQRTFRLLIDCI